MIEALAFGYVAALLPNHSDADIGKCHATLLPWIPYMV